MSETGRLNKRRPPMKRPLSVSVADKASPSGHALLLPAELRELLNSPDTYTIDL